MTRPRILYVSKPIAAPFKDGTKCLVRDLALNVERCTPVVMSARGAKGIVECFGPGKVPIDELRVYPNSGRYSPSLTHNLRAALWLFTRARADLWHFVFAPNPRTSSVGAGLKRLRRVPVLQTVASPPRSFQDIDQLLFGDIVVAQSEWTKQRILAAYAALPARPRPPRVEVIWPSLTPPRARKLEEQRRARALVGAQWDTPLFVYPGDLETSSAARFILELAPELARVWPNSVTVLAYRAKSPRAHRLADELRAKLDASNVRLIANVPDIAGLIGTAQAVLFPVDDLWGKVDLPIVLLEAMQIGTPVVALAEGPLAELQGTVQVPALASADWVSALERVLSPSERPRIIEAQRAAIEKYHQAATVARAYERLYADLCAAEPSAA